MRAICWTTESSASRVRSTFDDRDSYLTSLQGLAAIVTGAERLKVFEDGDDACVIYELRTQPAPSARIAEWYRVREGRIARMLVLFDARPFAALFEQARQR